MSKDFGNFIGNGNSYVIHTPVTPATWFNYLFNDDYFMEVSQTLQGSSNIVRSYTQEAVTTGYRYFYILNHETKKAFNPNYVPLCREPESFSCTHSLNATHLAAECDGISCQIKVMVPVSGFGEIWSIELKNVTDTSQHISLFSVVGFEDQGVMGGECTFDIENKVLYKYAFPYHVCYEDKEKVEKNPGYTYMFSDIAPSSYEMSQRRFWGGDDIGQYPAALRKECCSNIPGEAENFCGCLQHEFVLEPGEAAECNIRIGVAHSTNEMRTLKKTWDKHCVKELQIESNEYWEKLSSSFRIKTPDANLDLFANYWLKKQITLLTRLNRGGTYCPVRNQLQDAMGYSMVAAKDAVRYIYSVLSFQHSSGFITQCYMTDNSPKKALCLLHHTDGPIWLVIGVITVINQNGDASMLENMVAYTDGTIESVSQHLQRAILYMYHHRGHHGLCLVGDGDWNDPINGVGRKGKGESTWSTLALIYCINLMLEYMSEYMDAGVLKKWEQMKTELKKCVNQYCFVSDRYVAGFDDDGVAYGSPEDHDIYFLNAQTWAIISDTATYDIGKILNKTMQRLNTPFGPVLLDPPFMSWNERWGRISLKKAGTTENGSVYCHASMFKAYADACLRDGNAVYDTIVRTLPTNPENPTSNNLQVPIFVPNYYYALEGSANYGRSSCNYGTGTAAWMLLVIMEELIGVKATVHGIEIHPCLPDGWKEVQCIRQFREAAYHITIKKGNGMCAKSNEQEFTGIKVNGSIYTKRTLPYETGGIYKVEVSCPDTTNLSKEQLK